MGINGLDNTASPIELKGTHCEKGKKQSVPLHFRASACRNPIVARAARRRGQLSASATSGPGRSGRLVQDYAILNVSSTPPFSDSLPLSLFISFSISFSLAPPDGPDSAAPRGVRSGCCVCVRATSKGVQLTFLLDLSSDIIFTVLRLATLFAYPGVGAILTDTSFAATVGCAAR